MGDISEYSNYNVSDVVWLRLFGACKWILLLRLLASSILIAMLSGCVIPIPAGYNNASEPPVMNVVEGKNLIAEHQFPNYCALSTSVIDVTAPIAIAQVNCQGRVRLSGDGSHLFLYGSRNNPEKIRLIDLGEDSKFDAHLMAPKPDRDGRIPSGIRYSMLVLKNNIAVDLKTGKRFEIPNLSMAAEISPDFKLQPGTTAERRVFTSKRTKVLFATEHLSSVGNTVLDPYGSKREIYLMGTHGKPAISWPYSGSNRVFLDDFSQAPVPGPSVESLAELKKIESDFDFGLLGSNTATNHRYGIGWTNLVAQSADGHFTIWGWNGLDETPTGYGVFKMGSDRPLWMSSFEGKPPHVGFTLDSVPRVFGRQSYRISREVAYKLFDIESGDLMGEVGMSQVPIWPPDRTPVAPPGLQNSVFCNVGSTECTENEKNFAWYSYDPSGASELVIVEKHDGVEVFRQSLEKSMKNSHARAVSIHLANSADRIAVLSRDGKARVFDF